MRTINEITMVIDMRKTFALNKQIVETFGVYFYKSTSMFSY